MSFNGCSADEIAEWGWRRGANAMLPIKSTKGNDMSENGPDLNAVGIDGRTFGEAFAGAAVASATAPRIHVGVGAMVERSEAIAGRPRMVLPASRRCSANIPENLNDIWWRDAKVDKPVDETPVQFYDGKAIHSGCRTKVNGVFNWEDGSRDTGGPVSWSDAEVTYWMPQPSLPK